jgi:hypothetical protein
VTGSVPWQLLATSGHSAAMLNDRFAEKPGNRAELGALQLADLFGLSSAVTRESEGARKG